MIKPNKILFVPILTVSAISADQIVEEVVFPCTPVPQEIQSMYGCSIHMLEDHLGIKLVDVNDRSLVIQTISDAMETYGFSPLSENVYWYPGERSCYFSWFGLESDELVFVRSNKFPLARSSKFCGIERTRYEPENFATIIEQELQKKNLQSSTSVYFTNIVIDTPIYKEILQNGGSPGLMVILDEHEQLQLVTIDMEY